MMEITDRATSELIPYANNARTHTEHQIKQIAASIQEFGFNNPVLIDEESGIIAGHGRVLAAEKLKRESVPCIELEGLSEAQKKAYIIADNNLALNAGWDDELLKTELERLKELDFDLSLLGFDEDLADLLPGTDNIGLTDPDDLPELPETPVSVVGDVWKLGGHKLFCGSSIDRDSIIAFIGNDRPVMMFTDPPYGVSYKSDNEKHGRIMGDKTQATIPVSFSIAVNHVLDDNARIYICGGEVNLMMYFSIFDCELRKQPKIIIWKKDNFILRPINYHCQFEIIYFSAKGDGLGKKYWYTGRGGEECSDILDIHRDPFKEYLHPTQKPVNLSTRCIKNSSIESDYVYEPFGGSGSTLIACEMLKRKCICVEIDPYFVDVIVNRWQDFTGQEAIHAESGKTFQEIKNDVQR